MMNIAAAGKTIKLFGEYQPNIALVVVSIKNSGLLPMILIPAKLPLPNTSRITATATKIAP